MLHLSVLLQLVLEIIFSCLLYTTQQYQDFKKGILHLKLLGFWSFSIVRYSRVS
jgi:hypothetical protein